MKRRGFLKAVAGLLSFGTAAKALPKLSAADVAAAAPGTDKTFRAAAMYTLNPGKTTVIRKKDCVWQITTHYDCHERDG